MLNYSYNHKKNKNLKGFKEKLFHGLCSYGKGLKIQHPQLDSPWHFLFTRVKKSPSCQPQSPPLAPHMIHGAIQFKKKIKIKEEGT